MIKGEGDKMGRARIWVSSIRERKRCKGKTLKELTNTKKKPYKWVALVHAHRKNNDKQSP
jgi:hypothetical protein